MFYSEVRRGIFCFLTEVYLAIAAEAPLVLAQLICHPLVYIWCLFLEFFPNTTRMLGPEIEKVLWLRTFGYFFHQRSNAIKLISTSKRFSSGSYSPPQSSSAILKVSASGVSQRSSWTNSW